MRKSTAWPRSYTVQGVGESARFLVLVLLALYCAGCPGRVRTDDTPEEACTKPDRLTLSDNGRLALVEPGTEYGIHAYDVTTGKHLWYHHELVLDRLVVASSHGGVVVAMLGAENLHILKGGEHEVSTLPFDGNRVRALGISDDATRLAVVRLPEGRITTDNEVNPALLEIWAVPPGRSPLASVEAPIVSTVWFHGSDDLTRFFILSSSTIYNKKVASAYELDEDGGLSMLWKIVDDPIPIYGMASRELVIETTGTGVRVHKESEIIDLDFGAFARPRFSVGGRYLLLDSPGQGESQRHIRALEIASLRIVREITLPTDHSITEYSLDDDLVLREVKLLQGTFSIQRVDW